MQYQTFPGVRGDSQSLDKLKALRLPSLAGRRFLDVGCNEGFFCGYAKFDGAVQAVGIDRSRAAIGRARNKFPSCEFLQQSWEDLPDGPFDVILLASALHYADDQAALISKLMSRVSEDGTLVLEVGVVNSISNEWVRVKRSIDERPFPTWKKLEEVLAGHAWKSIGYSVEQAGDPVRRYVIHVRRKRPCVFLLLAPPASGKTTLSKTFFAKAGIPVVSGDRLYYEISKNTVPAPDGIKALIAERFSPVDIAGLTEQVFSQGLVGQLVDLWCAQHGYRDFALDSYVPDKHHSMVQELFFDRGYIPVNMSWMIEKSIPQADEASRKANRYFTALSETLREESGNRICVSRVGSESISQHIARWHLDYPGDGQPLVGDEPVNIAGWALPAADEGRLQCYVKTASGTQVVEFNRSRQDVIDALYKGEAVAEGRVLCGFNFSIPAETLTSGAELGFVGEQGQKVPAARLTVVSGRGVKSGNVFLRLRGFLRRLAGGKCKRNVRGSLIGQ
jgi:SAM-dependent methyltransferase